ncbi:MAG: F0F1 ATP synthase subunit B [Bacteroidaceae bacterium]|nr:F0F1 ATP synthase subunit B [Bacteroidaceae bacterium]MBR1520822.1 F0F1 ATP synthase subunit B [Bacteroidaceae bacterium]
MNLLTPEPGLLFWMVLSFGVVFFLLAKFGFPVIVKAINERKEFIEMSLLSAKQANEKLASIQAEGEQLLADAKAQQKEIIAGAMQEKQQILNAAQEEARTSAQQMVDDARQSIRAEKEKALNEVRKEVASLALDIAEKVIGERMKDEAAQKRAIEQMIEKL